MAAWNWWLRPSLVTDEVRQFLDRLALTLWTPWLVLETAPVVSREGRPWNLPS